MNWDTKFEFQIVFMVQCQVSVERINKFMNADELDPDSVTHKENFEDPIVVENADFTWNANVSSISYPTYGFMSNYVSTNHWGHVCTSYFLSCLPLLPQYLF